uniref:Uncharacterized protein n=1 Tax=Panagrolaimus sp. PS1159 TaxID=55785 RepID=A0AC35GWV5_9BILA
MKNEFIYDMHCIYWSSNLLLSCIFQFEKTVLKQEKPADDTVEEVNVKKSFKHIAAKEYEKCKYECKKKIDQISAKEYVEQLTKELKLAKEYLASQEKALSHEAKNTITQDDKIEIPPTGEEDKIDS